MAESDDVGIEMHDPNSHSVGKLAHVPWDFVIVFDNVTQEEAEAVEGSFCDKYCCGERALKALRAHQRFIGENNAKQGSKESFVWACYKAGLQVSTKSRAEWQSWRQVGDQHGNDAMQNFKLSVATGDWEIASGATEDIIADNEEEGLTSWQGIRAVERFHELLDGDLSKADRAKIGNMKGCDTRMTKKAHYEKKFEALREKRKERGRNYDSTEENEFIQADTLLTDLFQIYCRLANHRVANLQNAEEFEKRLEWFNRFGPDLEATNGRESEHSDIEEVYMAGYTPDALPLSKDTVAETKKELCKKLLELAPFYNQFHVPNWQGVHRLARVALTAEESPTGLRDKVQALRVFGVELPKWYEDFMRPGDISTLDAPCTPVHGGESLYVLIRASRQRLMEEAERIGFMVDCADALEERTQDDDKADEDLAGDGFSENQLKPLPPRPKGLESFTTEEFDPNRYDKGYYWTPGNESNDEKTQKFLIKWNGRDTEGNLIANCRMNSGYRFFSSQKQRLIYSILLTQREYGGAEINLGDLKQKGILKSFFSLDDAEMKQALSERWHSMWWNWWFIGEVCASVRYILCCETLSCIYSICNGASEYTTKQKQLQDIQNKMDRMEEKALVANGAYVASGDELEERKTVVTELDNANPGVLDASVQKSLVERFKKDQIQEWVELAIQRQQKQEESQDAMQAQCCFQFPGYKPYCNRMSLLSDIRDYYGEQIAMYFAFISFYCRWLCMPGLVGLVAWANQDPSENGEVTGQRSLLAYSFFLCIWAPIFLKFWRRAQNLHAYEWDTEDAKEGALDDQRPEFVVERDHQLGFYSSRGWIDLSNNDDKVSADVWTPKEQGGRAWAVYEPEGYTPEEWHEVHKSKLLHARREGEMGAKCITAASYPVMAVLIVSLVIATLGVMVFRLWAKSGIGENYYEGPLVSGILNGVCILILSTVIDMISLELTNAQNCRTQAEFETQLVSKLFWFQFINSYVGLFYIALVQFIGGYSQIKIFGQTDKCFPSVQAKAEYQAAHPEDKEPWTICYAALSSQLIGILISKIFVDGIFDYALPCVLNGINTGNWGCGEEQDAANASNLSEDASNEEIIEEQKENLNEFEQQIDRCPHGGVLYDYNQLTLTFGFVVMFGAAWPLAPFVVCLYNFSQAFVDQKKLLHQVQRPLYIPVPDIGAWEECLRIVAFFGIMTNMIICWATTRDIQEKGLWGSPMTQTEAILTGVAMEHIILIVRQIVDLSIDDVPDKVVMCKALDDFTDSVYTSASHEARLTKANKED